MKIIYLYSDEPFISLTYIRTTYVQCLELISYGMARLCLVIPQPHSFYCDYALTTVLEKLSLLRLNISGI